jgi:hypothetical protein
MFKWLKRARYSDLFLSNRQSSLIAAIDVELEQRLSGPSDGQLLSIVPVQVPLSQQFLPESVILKYMKRQLPESGAYIPRSVAFVQSGADWYFLIGVYQDVYQDQPVNNIEQIMFIELLTRTNTARKEFE